MEVSGHAASGEYGLDIVCASVSILIFNFANSIAELTGIEPEMTTVDGGGFLIIKRPAGFSLKQEQVWETLFSSVLIGIENLAENSSAYVAKPVINQEFNGGTKND